MSEFEDAIAREVDSVTEEQQRPKRGRLGDRLLDKALIDGAQLEVALNEQRRAHRPLGEILVSLGFISPEDLAKLLAEDLDVPFVRARDVHPDPLLISALDADFVRETLAFPIELAEGRLRVAMVDPDDLPKVAAVRERFPYPLDVWVTTEKEILGLLREHVQSSLSLVGEIFHGLQGRELNLATEFPVEAVTDAILIDAVHRGATDIHIEPEERVTRVRYRIDGILQPAESLPVEATPAVISRLKILSHLDISERRRPQDGRMRIVVDDNPVDMRVSMMPCVYGENAVMRILDTSTGVLTLEALGMPTKTQRVLRTIMERPHGMFLVTGPTGSGKTTTLYAMLASIDAMHRNVATVEDPVEYRLPLLRQSQMDPAIGFSFHEGLRALLRQDPDVILIGEIRDRETADMAVKAAMTGHMVLSTLHTNSAVGAVPRLVDIGVEPYLLEDCLIAVLAQRLVRRNCPGCRVEREPTAEEREWLGGEVESVWSAQGCERCEKSGYSGRTALMELFMPDARLADSIRAGVSQGELEKLAQETGFQSMEEDGKRLVREGITTMTEVLRVNSCHRLSKEERCGL